MKKIYTLSVLSFILISTLPVKAQVTTSSRPSAYARYADKLPTKPNELEKAFSSPAGTKITFNFSNFTYSGIITSTVKRNCTLSTVVIKSTTLENSIFSISKKLNDDKTVTYIGRIINQNYADGYEIIKDDKGNYALNKTKTDVLIQDF
jgi:hypothetical protein